MPAEKALGSSLATRAHTTRANSLGRADLVRCWAGFASLGAGLVHLAVVQEHLAVWWGYGAFFLVLAVVQVGWALAALAARGQAPLRRTVAYGSLAVVALWVFTRTVGVPAGPDAWTTEEVGRADVLAGVLELAVAGALLWLGRARPAAASPANRTSLGGFLWLMFAGALVVSFATTAAIAATSAGGGGH